MTTIAGSRAWIIGASSGIGAALADEMHRRGAQVAISARRADALAQVSAGRMLEVPLDIADMQAVVDAARAVRAAMGELDIVVIAAGYWKRMEAAGFDVEEFQRHIDANVMGMAHCIAAVLPEMSARGSGSIVGISSVAGYRGMPGSQGYGASKAAQLNLLESLRCGMHGTGVHIQTVAPGFVETPMTATNTFPMPFLVSAERAATAIADGIEHETPEIVFPLPMAIAMKTARLVPQRWWPRLFGNRAA